MTNEYFRGGSMKQFVAIFFIIISITVFSAPDKVKLEYKFDQNRFQAFQMVTTTKSEFSMFGIDQKTGSKLILNIHREVEDGPKTGVFKIKNVVDSGKIIIQGKESEYAGEGNSTEVLMDKTGVIIEDLSREDKKINELQINFPDKEIRVGDYWGTQAEIDVSDISEKVKKLKIQMTFVLKGFETYRGQECAVIESRFDSTKIDERYLNVNIKGNGKIYFAYEEGKLLANFNKLKIHFDVKSDQNNEGRLRTIFSTDLDMLTQLTSL